MSAHVQRRTQLLAPACEMLTHLDFSGEWRTRTGVAVVQELLEFVEQTDISTVQLPSTLLGGCPRNITHVCAEFNPKWGRKKECACCIDSW